MIYFYSGTGGSGKSLDVVRDICIKLKVRKQNVITDMDIDYSYICQIPWKVKVNKILEKVGLKYRFKDTLDSSKGEIGEIITINNIYDLHPQFFYDYALKHHTQGIEGQTLIVIDEAQRIFSPNYVKDKTGMTKQEKPPWNYRQEWLNFFSQHRHLGYNIIIVSLFDKLIDPQIRCLFEYNVIHRKIENFNNFFGVIVKILQSIFKFKLFIAVEYWYGVKVKVSHRYYVYKKKYHRIYNSYKRFDELKNKELEQKQKEEKTA